MEESSNPQLSTETHCTLTALALKDVLKQMHRACKAHELEPTEEGAAQLRALRDLAWTILPEMADVLADHLGYQPARSPLSPQVVST